jgi:adenine deaminase
MRGYPVPGAGLHRELAALVRAGLSPIEAIRAATSAAGDLVGAKPTTVRFAPGTDANFIIVSGDPLKQIEDLSNITHVVRAGEVFEPKVLLARAQQTLAPRGLKPPGSISSWRPGLQTRHEARGHQP